MNQLVYEKISRKPQQFVRILYFNHEQNPEKVPKHWHRSIELIYPRQGYMHLWENGESHKIAAGDFHVINSQAIHACHRGSIDYDGYAIQIDICFIKIIYPQIESVAFIKEDNPELKQDILKILDKMVSVKPSETSEIEINGYATLLISRLLSGAVTRTSGSELQNNQHSHLIMEIMAFIDENYYEKLSSREIADKYNLSYGYLARIFKDTTGMTLSQYIKHQRLENAINDLRFSSLNITQIALKNGFSDYKSFDKMFKERYKMKPSAYKEKISN